MAWMAKKRNPSQRLVGMNEEETKCKSLVNITRKHSSVKNCRISVSLGQTTVLTSHIQRSIILQRSGALERCRGTPGRYFLATGSTRLVLVV